jgi:hypothetical protein
MFFENACRKDQPFTDGFSERNPYNWLKRFLSVIM